jgi:hypothetical protein
LVAGALAGIKHHVPNSRNSKKFNGEATSSLHARERHQRRWRRGMRDTGYVRRNQHNLKNPLPDKGEDREGFALK